MAEKIKEKPQAEEDLELGDIEEYRSGYDRKFSHQALIMQCMARVNELGGHELVEGAYSQTFDPKKNIMRIVYKEDTKKAFIEAVKTTKSNMICDLDEEGAENIKQILTNLKKRKEELMKEQITFWTELGEEGQYALAKRFNSNIVVSEKQFSNALPQLYEYKEEEIETYREIHEELVLQTSRIDFYQGEDFEA